MVDLMDNAGTQSLGRGQQHSHANENSGQNIGVLERRVADLTEQLADALHQLQSQVDLRRRIEDDMRHSGQKVRDIFDKHKAIFLLVEPGSGAIVYANKAATTFYGYTQDQLQRLSIADINVAPTEETTLHRHHGMEHDEDHFSATHRLAGGDFRTVKVHSSPVEIEGHTLLFSIIHDITDQVRAETSLREAELRYRGIVENAVMGVFQSSPIGRFLAVNLAMAHIYGYATAQEMIESVGGEIQYRIHVSSEKRAEFRRILDVDGTVHDFEAPNYRKDGSVIWTRTSARTVRDASGAVQYYEGFLVDITEQKIAEEKVNRHMATAAALLRTAERLNAQLDLDSVLKLACDEASSALNVPVAWISLYEPASDAFEFAHTVGLPSDYVGHWAPLPRSIIERNGIYANGFYYTPDLRERTVHDAPNLVLLARADVRSIISVMMMRDNQLVGLLSVAVTGESRQFTDEDKALLKGLSDIAGQAVANARLHMDTQRRLRNEMAMRTVEMAIASNGDPHATLVVILDQLILQLNVDAADIMLIAPGSTVLQFAAGYGFSTELIMHGVVPLGQQYAGQAALHKQTIVRNGDARAADEDLTTGFREFLNRENFQTHIVTPLVVDGVARGVLEVFNRKKLKIDAEWLRFLEAFAGHAAMAIVNASLLEGLRQSNVDLAEAYDATITGWSRALDLRDRDTEGHTQRVADASVAMATAVGMDEQEIVTIRRGALLHDIGKMGVPDEILLKPGPLTEQEWVVMRRHPVYAYEWLKPITFLGDAIAIPFCHHEDWDGNGYPRGLKGEEIPLAARIFAIVDAWDALSSDRPYRKSWSKEKVGSYLREQAGKRFDPDVVELFLARM